MPLMAKCNAMSSEDLTIFFSTDSKSPKLESSPQESSGILSSVGICEGLTSAERFYYMSNFYAPHTLVPSTFPKNFRIGIFGSVCGKMFGGMFLQLHWSKHCGTAHSSYVSLFLHVDTLHTRLLMHI